jgi:hypothetical protein
MKKYTSLDIGSDPSIRKRQGYHRIAVFMIAAAAFFVTAPNIASANECQERLDQCLGDCEATGNNCNAQAQYELDRAFAQCEQEHSDCNVQCGQEGAECPHQYCASAQVICKENAYYEYQRNMHWCDQYRWSCNNDCQFEYWDCFRT